MPRRKRNIEAFTDKRGVVHPIRRSSGYDDEKTGSTDFDFRDWAAEEREQRKDEERALEKEIARYHPEAGKSLATFVRQRGGFRYDGIHDGEIDRLRKGESGTSGLVSLDKGKGLTFKRGRGLKPDRMLEAAIEAGVVSPDTSLSRFMDDVEMSATKRNPIHPADAAISARMKWLRAEAAAEKAQRLTPLWDDKETKEERLARRLKAEYERLVKKADRAKNPFPSATVEKAWQAWRKAEKAKSPKAQALETKFVKVYMASQKKNPGRRYLKKDVGKPVLFEGYDDKQYYAIIDDVRRGIAVITYGIPGRKGLVKAYVPIRDQWRLKEQNPMSLEAARRIRDKKEERSYKLLQAAAHKAIHAKTPAGKKKAEKAYQRAEQAYWRVKGEAVTRRRVAAGLEKKRNFTIKAAGRLKVGNPGSARVRRLRTRTAKQERISPALGAKAHEQSERAFKQWANARDRRVGKAIVAGRQWPKFGKQNPKSADHDAARELTLFIVNDYQLYERRLPSFIANVARKMKAGTYDHQKAAKLYSYLAQEGAKKYSREYSTGRDSAAMFSPATRLETGRQLADHYEQAAREEAERLKQKAPARKKKRNISIKVGGKTRFKASKKGVSIGGRVQLKANPGGTKKNGSISEKRQDRLWRSAQKAQKAGKTALADQRLTRSAALARKVQGKWYSQTRVEDRKKRFKNPVRIVFNRLLGGWYIVHGPHHTPISGRFSSREEAKAHMAAQQAARDQRGLPKHRRNGIFETFTGRKATKQTALNAPDGTPKRLDKLGKLIGLYAENGTIKPRVPVWLCSDSKGKLHLATSAARLIDGGPQSFGEVKKIEYETTKKHLDGKPTIYFHHFGEEGGKRPTLHADGKGGLKLRGGSYKIRAEGIRD